MIKWLDRLLRKNKVEYCSNYKTIKKTDFELKFPVEVGDSILFKNGKEYKVQDSSMTGCVSGSLYFLHRVNGIDIHLGGKKHLSFKTLRELNFVLEQQKDIIQKIWCEDLKRKPNKNAKVKSMDELHKEALKFNAQRDRVKSMFESFKEDLNGKSY